MPRARIRNTGAGYIIGETAPEAVGFHGASPVPQRSGAAQAVVAVTSVQAGGAPTEAQYNAAQVDIAALTVLVNELRAALVQKGLIKGSA